MTSHILKTSTILNTLLTLAGTIYTHKYVLPLDQINTFYKIFLILSLILMLVYNLEIIKNETDYGKFSLGFLLQIACFVVLVFGCRRTDLLDQYYKYYL